MSTRVRTVSLSAFLGVWSFAFARVHVAWALGWTAGVPADPAPISERPWFLAYDLLAGLLMYAAAAVCAVFAMGGETPLLRWARSSAPCWPWAGASQPWCSTWARAT
jgi:hypothetical protein